MMDTPYPTHNNKPCDHSPSGTTILPQIEVFDTLLQELCQQNNDEGFHQVATKLLEHHQTFVTTNGNSPILSAYYGMAADCILREDWSEARHNMGSALILDNLNQDDVWFAKIIERIRTKKGLVTEVARHLSCLCLEGTQRKMMDDAENLRQWNLRPQQQPSSSIMEDTICCFQCYQEKPRDQIYLCGACRLASYCSRDCQKANWCVEHKQLCDQYRALME